MKNRLQVKGRILLQDAIENGHLMLPLFCIVCLCTFVSLYASQSLESQAQSLHEDQFESISVRLNANTVSTDNGIASVQNQGDVLAKANQARANEGKRHIYLSEIIRRIESAKRYPRLERQAGLEDQVSVRLRILPDGSLKECALIVFSQYAGFNQEAMASIRRAGPFPPFPPEYNEDEAVLLVTLQFRMADE